MKKEIESYPGLPLPLGVTLNRGEYNFAVFSKHASKVFLQLYFGQDDTPSVELGFNSEINRTGDVWHICLENLPDHFHYTYRVDGPWSIEDGFTFNQEHLLIDPYAKCLSGMESWGERKSSLKGFVGEHEFDWEGDRPLNRLLKETIIYELHVRGFTAFQNSGVDKPGTFQGVVEKIPYLKELGITAVELLPIHAFDEIDCKYENPSTRKKLHNYWGYSSLNFFALKSSYAATSEDNGVVIEFKNLVKSLHSAGIEVIIDVVFNHTAEGGWDRSVINFKGLENSVYYILDDSGDYINYSGCGNTLNCNHPVVMKMILDSLQYWVLEMHVDGFRFDLASIFSRDSNGLVLSSPPILDLIADDPILSKTKIIAEAWDAVGLYQVGHFHDSLHWAEWNGKYRDAVRKFCQGESGLSGEIATRISGSEDLYGHSGKNPSHSINFITSHDGFTLMDLVSYQKKSNLQNGENNQDGTRDNFSLNFGVEGETSDWQIIEKRKQQIRNMAVILLFSQGTPMILAGDEFGNSQQGNNNAWCQDNEISWLDWDLLKKNHELFLFWQKLIQFRKIHPVFSQGHFFTGENNQASKVSDISWHNQFAYQPDFEKATRSLAFMVDSRWEENDEGTIMYVAMNFNESNLIFEIPEVQSQTQWQHVLSTVDFQNFIQDHHFRLPRGQSRIDVDAFSISILTRNY